MPEHRLCDCFAGGKGMTSGKLRTGLVLEEEIKDNVRVWLISVNGG
jgi:hypothetical protein